jgi:hypothetical protein
VKQADSEFWKDMVENKGLSKEEISRNEEYIDRQNREEKAIAKKISFSIQRQKFLHWEK